jgi:hypothetical protein
VTRRVSCEDEHPGANQLVTNMRASTNEVMRSSSPPLSGPCGSLDRPAERAGGNLLDETCIATLLSRTVVDAERSWQQVVGDHSRFAPRRCRPADHVRACQRAPEWLFAAGPRTR